MANILITGVNRGIGAALHQAASAAGHHVIGTTRDGRNGTIALELSDPAAVADQLGELPQIDVLINNAGIIGPQSDQQSPLSMDWDGMRETFAINSIAPLAVAQSALPTLRKSEQPRILTISSQMASFATPKSNQIAYRASKAAVNKVMQGLAVELEPEGIPVVVINPGWVRTDMGGAGADEDPNDVAQGILAIMERLTIEDTGKFLRFTGEEFAY
ncbi:SDR family NAD(P)-dependent oxidoreductase [Loktanella sp. F6476L]|uniref:SDR family NAD(P)-dependent oxidoreductase n=1 Tax=Loktanella sp. F6476L TaxID=2926405 RepID=UPI001FF188FD|nr:SDR family NAD(P)-dependent oxidoreductase [Loktanella sp. F6476L]MCK0119749.1 SDR family NAD(P)-dependent oxidoreductase [Loktanella sp. F6476L]